MTGTEAFLQGVLQGATEFLPVSSSGHLSLMQHILGIRVESLLFDVMLHLGTLLAVVLAYYKLIWRLILALIKTVRQIFTKQFHWKEMDDDQRMVFMLLLGLLPLGCLFLPLPVLGGNLKDLSDRLATDSTIFAEGLSFLMTGILLLVGLRANRQVQLSRRTRASQGVRKHSIGRSKFHTWDAITVGFGQLFAAVFPGLSRSGTTMSFGMLRGISQQTALDYSFVLGIPSIFAAAALTAKEAVEKSESFDKLPMLIGVVTAAVVGFLAIQLLRWVVKSRKLKFFAVYVLVLGTAVILVSLLEDYTGMNIFTGVTIGKLVD